MTDKAFCFYLEHIWYRGQWCKRRFHCKHNRWKDWKIEMTGRDEGQRKLDGNALQIEEEIYNLPLPDSHPDMRIDQDCFDRRIQG